MRASKQAEGRGLLSSLLAWAANTIALFIAAALIHGVSYTHAHSVIIMAAILVVASWVIEPFLYILTLPINLATFGLFTVIINAMVLLLVSELPHGFAFHGRLWG